MQWPASDRFLMATTQSCLKPGTESVIIQRTNHNAMEPSEQIEIKSHKCDTCGVQFKTNWTLTAHIRTHTGEKPFKCDLCASCFTQKGALKRHRKTHTHPEEKPYKCETCGLRFAYSYHVKTHMPIHTGEKPFKCHLLNHVLLGKNT